MGIQHGYTAMGIQQWVTQQYQYAAIYGDNNITYCMSSQRKYTFIVEWFDPSASLIKQFYFTFFVPAQQIEMYDIKNQKIFLKKIQYPEIKLTDLYIGNVVVCYNRQLKIVAFGDEFTRKELVGEDTSNKTYGMLKPNAYLNFGKMIAATEKEFTIANLKMFQFDEESAGQFYGEHKGKGFYPTLINFMTSDYSVGMELISQNAITKWRKFIGPTNSQKAREEAPKSLRALYGEDGTKNACHGSDAPTSADREIGLIFSSQAVVRSRPYCENCTLCIIKPHAVKAKLIGEIVDFILSSGFEVSAMQMIWFDHAAAQEFYEPYKFLPEQKKMIDQLSSGPAVALEVRQDNAVEKLRKFCGPYDPEIARKLEPTTLRARFGLDRVQNAVHCTDLPEDGRLEVQYIFGTLLA